MIDNKLAQEKSDGKSECRFGLSVVSMISLDSQTQNICDLVETALGSFSGWFCWTSPQNRHITFLRCRSVSQDFCVPQSVIQYVSDALGHKKAFSLQSVNVRLGSDGVIRLYYSKVPNEFWALINTHQMLKLTNLRYKIVEEPWITISYCKSNAISSLERHCYEISHRLNNLSVSHLHYIDEIHLVKYSDNAFLNHNIVATFELGDSK